VMPLSAGEAAAAGELNLMPVIVDRAWDLWTAQLAAPHLPLSLQGVPT